MSRKIQFHTFHLLFRLFSYLADKSGGWSMFVRPKLVMGGVIVGLGLLIPKEVFAQIKSSNNENGRNLNKRTNTNDPKLPNSNIPKTQNVESTCYLIVESIPEFPGGHEKMLLFIQQKMIYPNDALNKRIEGLVVCSFIVSSNGLISNIELLRGVYPSLNNEAIRIIKLMPKWKPSEQGGKAVPVKFTLPIRFTLPDKKK